MKIVIFAGGVGTRLWPLSRKNSPKQFEKIFGDKSTLQETIDRLLPKFDASDIFVATGKRFEKTVREQLHMLPPDNFIFEPEMRDVGPAIGLVSIVLAKRFPNEPLAILWSDHMVRNADLFRSALKKAEAMVQKGKADFVFIAQKARFANQNIGWIEVGEKFSEKDSEVEVYQFKSLCYRPKLEDAQRFFREQTFVWNLGYFVTTPQFLLSLYKRLTPEMYEQLANLQEVQGTERFDKFVNVVYPTFKKVSFDDAILMKMKENNIFVISSDLGWSDIGAWEALKEALSNGGSDNVTKGNVLLEDSSDCLVFNYTKPLIVGIDLRELLVVATDDVVLVCPKTSVPKIKKLVEGFVGTEHEHLT